ncbi:MAG: hypothetical protein WKF86_00815 [Acidimicrobiales bacterium]
MRRPGLLIAVWLTVFATLERPAAAHGGGAVEATNYVTTLDRISPPLPGVRLRVIELGDRLELRNDGPEVVVLGYRGEPFVRVGPDGAFENRLSPTVQANREDHHGPADAGPLDTAAAPEWRRLSSEPVARWHDHRVHWAGPGDPPEVEADPGVRRAVQPAWTVTIRRGEEMSIASGQLTWVPGPSPGPWFALALGVVVAVAALGMLQRWGPPLAVAVGLLLGVDLLHTFAAAFASAGGLGDHLARVGMGSFYAIVGWVLAVIALRLLARGRVDGLYAGVFAGLSIGTFGGLIDISTLSRSVTIFALPELVARLCVALAAGGGFGLAAACVLVIRRTPEARRVTDEV